MVIVLKRFVAKIFHTEHLSILPQESLFETYNYFIIIISSSGYFREVTKCKALCGVLSVFRSMAYGR